MQNSSQRDYLQHIPVNNFAQISDNKFGGAYQQPHFPESFYNNLQPVNTPQQQDGEIYPTHYFNNDQPFNYDNADSNQAAQYQNPNQVPQTQDDDPQFQQPNFYQQQQPQYYQSPEEQIHQTPVSIQHQQYNLQQPHSFQGSYNPISSTGYIAPAQPQPVFHPQPPVFHQPQSQVKHNIHQPVGGGSMQPRLDNVQRLTPLPPVNVANGGPGTSVPITIPAQVIRKLERPVDTVLTKEVKKINKSVFKPSFWDQAPFKRNNQEKNHIIQVDYSLEVSIETNSLPNGYEWVTFDPENDADISVMTDFLNKHYQKFDKEYKPNYLKWILTPPSYKQYKRLDNTPTSTWCIGVQASKNGVLVGLITARPIMYRIDAKYIQSFTVDFLCTHRQLRQKKLAPVLIKEMYRRMSTVQYDIGCMFVSNTHLPFNSTVETSQILFRPLTLEKLSKTLFSSLTQQQLTQLQHRYENIQPTDDLQLIRFANLEDVPMMMHIYEEYCAKYRLCQTMNTEEFEHYFLPNNEMIFTYVITNAEGEIKDFISLHAFWTKRGEKNAYLYYVSFITETLLELFMRNILFIMKSNGFDMIFANDVMGISNVFSKKLDFKSLDEICNYYVFNYNTQTIDKNDCGMNRMF